MSFGVLTVLISLVSLYAYYIGSKHVMLLTLVTLSTNYFGLLPESFNFGPMNFQNGDFALLLIFFLLFFTTRNIAREVSGVQHALFFFFTFLLISIFYDFLFRGTSIMQIFRTIRHLGYMFFFFLIGNFSLRDYQKFVRLIFLITLVHSALYISQYIFSYSFTPYMKKYEVTEVVTSLARYRNSPEFLAPAVFTIAIFAISSMKKYYILLFFLISIALTQSRGQIVSAFIIILMFFYLNKSINLTSLLLITVVFIVFSNVLFYAYPIMAERFAHLLYEAQLMGDIKYNNLERLYYEGSVVFRTGLTYERFLYVLQDPVRMILGVGFVPDFDLKEPIFVLGTLSPSLPTGYEQYNSVDILFPNLITRYGFLGTVIFINVIIQILIYARKNKDLLWGRILITYLFSLMIISFINETFYNGRQFLLVFILMGLVLSLKETKSRINLLKISRI